MSLIRRPLNLWLRWTQRPTMERETDPLRLRAGFEKKAKLFFHAPRGSVLEQENLGDVPALWVRRGDCGDGSVILYLHGGGYFMGSSATYKAMIARLVQYARIPAVIPDYRLGPEHLFPAAFDDAVACYKALLARGYRGDQIVIGGDSAGGGLVMALLSAICTQKLPQPAMTFALSPLSDLTSSGVSIETCADTELVLPPARMSELARDYLPDGVDAKDPRASPLWAPFDGAGPVHLFASETEVLRDDTVRLATRLRAQGVRVHCTMVTGLPHVWTLFHNVLPEGRQTLKVLAGHIRIALGGAG